METCNVKCYAAMTCGRQCGPKKELHMRMRGDRRGAGDSPTATRAPRHPVHGAAWRFSLRGAFWVVAAIATWLGVWCIRAEIQHQYVRLLESRGCEVGYTPIAIWLPCKPAFADSSDRFFQMTHNVTFVEVTSAEEVQHAVAIVKELPTIREMELRLGGGCGLAWVSAHQTADKVQRELPRVQVKVTGFVISVVG
jgi:hypothetical protein